MEKILLVEDDEQLLFILSNSLENVGYPTLIAKNGEQAINLLNNDHDISLVVTDLLMPVVDGLELCNYIRENKQFENLPVLIITGQSDIFYKSKGFNAGADDYITKPVEFVEFMLRIKALLKRSRITNKGKILMGLNEPSAISTNGEISFTTKTGINIKFDKNRSVINLNGQDFYLTQTEFDLFRYLFNKKKEPTNSLELLEKMMNYPPGSGNPVSIRTHIRNIRTKIEKDPNNPEIIINIPKRGYLLNINDD
jgi:DNA-binding response OmpR family regulator